MTVIRIENKTVFYFPKFKAQKCQYSFKKTREKGRGEEIKKKKTFFTNDANYSLKKFLKSGKIEVC